MDHVGGLELVVCCNQHPGVRSLSASKRRDWWTQSKRLQSGAFVCLVDVTGSVLFFTVSDSTMRSANDKQARVRRAPSREDKSIMDDAQSKQAPLTLSDDENYLYIRLQLVEPTPSSLGEILRWFRNVGSSPQRCLVEFPNVLLASFKHTLEALQEMYKKPNVPFSDLLAPAKPLGTSPKVNPPQYALQAGFMFDATCLMNRGRGSLVIAPQALSEPADVESRSTLDPTQSAALLNTLSRELSLIQGPPGTGKSYAGEKIIKLLLANKGKASLGPILCVCYTNHALDQLLEHLLDDGVKSMIRLGSQSKSERLQDLNIRTVARQAQRTRSEKSDLYNREKEVRDTSQQIEQALLQLATSNPWSAVKAFLAGNCVMHHHELFGSADDGFQVVNRHPEKNIDKWLSSGLPGAQVRGMDILESAPLAAMSHDERRALHRHWLKRIRDPIIAEIISLYQEYTASITQRDRLRREVDLRCLQQADVVGVTTTGLARNLDMLRRLRCKVMVCEEAGEVLEAHLLTALLPSVEHAILIGDHLQLRPQIQNFELQSTNPRGQQYSLDMSLFERLVTPPTATNARLPFSVLQTQRRMHPSIAELVRCTLYPTLQDAENVKKYPGVVGMKKRLFWLHHEHLEAGAAKDDALATSHSNDY